MSPSDIRPPFTLETAHLKVKMAEAAWNTRDPQRVSLAYTPDSVWRNRDEFFQGRDAIVAFLTRKWAKELDYRLMKGLSLPMCESRRRQLDWVWLHLLRFGLPGNARLLAHLHRPDDHLFHVDPGRAIRLNKHEISGDRHAYQCRFRRRALKPE